MINQQVIKSSNKKKMYTMIAEVPGISRAKLASRAALSKTTVSVLVDELIQEGYVLDKGAVESKHQGRRPNSLVVNAKNNCVVVINWKARTIQIAAVSAAFGVTALEEYTPMKDAEPVCQIAGIVNTFIQNHAEGQHILGVCIVIPGIIDEKNHRIISTVLGLGTDENMIFKLREAIDDYPLAIFNDTACLAYAENAFGNIDINNYVYLNINEGVGASLIQNGKILRGATGLGTQFGHFSIDRNGEPCSCGNRGCLENRIGEMVLAKRAKECGALEEFDEQPILFRDVSQLAEQGNPGALRLIYGLADDLAFSIGNLITMFHPDAIVIGGMGRKLGEIYLNRVTEQVKQVGFRQFVEDVEIHYTTLKEDSVFTGAAKYYLDTHYDFMEDMGGTLFLY